MPRFGYRSDDDRRILQSLEPDAARRFDALIKQQARSDQRHRERLAPPNASDRLSARLANFTHGAGGGTKRPTLHVEA